jgi:hypothetical protein
MRSRSTSGGLFPRHVRTDDDVSEHIRLVLGHLIVHRERQDIGRTRLPEPFLLERRHRRTLDEEHRHLGPGIDALLDGGQAHERDQAPFVDGDVALLVGDEHLYGTLRRLVGHRFVGRFSSNRR